LVLCFWKKTKTEHNRGKQSRRRRKMVSEQQRIAEEILQESKVAALETSGTMSGPLVGAAERTRRRRRVEAMQLLLRGLCMASSVLSISLMVTAEESSSVSIYGFQLPLHSKWSFSESYE